MTSRRVVITGVGAVTPVGLDIETTWENLLAGKSGAVPITRFDVSDHPTKFACEVQEDFLAQNFFDKPTARRMDLYTQYMIVATRQAMEQSGLELPEEGSPRAGCVLGTGIGGINELESTKELFLKRGPSRVSPFFIPKMMSNAIAGNVAIQFGLQGTCFATSSACASAGNAIGMSLKSIQWDECDVMITGGSEAATTALSLAGFCALKALSTRNDDPARASRPFDRDRDGFVMGEGAAALVFEEYEHAKRRGAPILAEVLGYGSTDDAFHITAPVESGSGAIRAMEAALRDAGVEPDQVDYVNAHGTSTELNDRVETLAIKQVFGDHARKLQVSSTKSMIGHLLGASGAIELAVTALTVARGQITPTINLETPDPNCDLDYVPNETRDAAVRVAISNSLGFGGHNTCLVLGSIDR